MPHTTTTSSPLDTRDVVRTMFTPSLMLKIVSSFPASTLHSSASDDSLPARHHEGGWPLPSRCAPRAFHDSRPSGCHGSRPSSYSTSWHWSCQLRSHPLIETFYQETACRADSPSFDSLRIMCHRKHDCSLVLLQVKADDTHSLQMTCLSRHKRPILALIRQVDAKVHIDTT